MTTLSTLPTLLAARPGFQAPGIEEFNYGCYGWSKFLGPACLSRTSVLILLRNTTAFSRTAFALATVIGACVFLIAELRIALRSRTPYVEAEERPRSRESRRG